ncbi:MAG TPA: MSMEG_0565 family glycosyltransferase [Acidimicrobiales bacterium]|nr:MSMEG_0565 family glycosyltransferase [Acidimicrobiales bacterium]
MTRLALVTYSTKPRGGVVHTLALAEALADRGADVAVIALAEEGAGFHRPVRVPCHFVPAPPPAPTLEERVFNSLDALAHGLEALGPDLPPLLHTQDCIAARAACRVRDAGAPITVVRTVHHVDDFTTPALVECQRLAILVPDRVLVVSRMWQRILMADYGVAADVVPNGVDLPRFAARPDPGTIAELRQRVGATERPLVLTVGGIEPRKGSDHLVRGFAALGGRLPVPPVLAVVGGHSFQDHGAYREAVLGSLSGLGLELGEDVVLVGTVPDDELPAWYHAADAFAFPSVNEGWGLAVLEAMAAGLPVVATDIPVFREYLTPGQDALLVPPGDDDALAVALATVLEDGATRDRLVDAGREVAAAYGWEASAERHLAIYKELA